MTRNTISCLVRCLGAVGMIAAGYTVGCGSSAGTGDTATSAASATISIAVQAPTETSANVAVASASKSLALADTSTDEPAESAVGNGLACEIRIVGGASLGTDTTDTDGKCAVAVDPTKADGKDLLFIVTLGNGTKIARLLPAATATAGKTTDGGTANSASSVVVHMIGQDAEASTGSTLTLDDTDKWVTQQTNGKMAPLKALVKTFENLMDQSGSADASTTAGLTKATRLAFKKAIVNGKKADEFVQKFLRADSATVSEAATLTGLSLTTSGVTGTLVQGVTAFDTLFQSSELFTEYNKTGAWDKCAAWIGGTDPAKIAANPTYFQGLIKASATNFLAGDTAALNVLTTGGTALAEVGSSCAGTTVTDFTAAYQILGKLTERIASSSASTATQAEYGKGVCAVLQASGSSTSKLSQVTGNADTLAAGIINNPTAFQGEGSTAVINNWLVVGQQLGSSKTAYNDLKPCTANSDCATGQSCGASFCTASTITGDSRLFGSVCTADSQCATGKCSTGFCGFDSTVDPLALPTGGGMIGAVCTSADQCLSKTCTSGVCAAATTSGSTSGSTGGTTAVSRDGTYARSGSQSCAGSGNTPTSMSILGTTHTLPGFAGSNTISFSGSTCTASICSNPAVGGSCSVSGTTITLTNCQFGASTSDKCTVNYAFQSSSQPAAEVSRDGSYSRTGTPSCVGSGSTSTAMSISGTTLSFTGQPGSNTISFSGSTCTATNCQSVSGSCAVSGTTVTFTSCRFGASASDKCTVSYVK